MKKILKFLSNVWAKSYIPARFFLGALCFLAVACKDTADIKASLPPSPEIVKEEISYLNLEEVRKFFSETLLVHVPSEVSSATYFDLGKVGEYLSKDIGSGRLANYFFAKNFIPKLRNSGCVLADVLDKDVLSNILDEAIYFELAKAGGASSRNSLGKVSSVFLASTNANRLYDCAPNLFSEMTEDSDKSSSGAGQQKALLKTQFGYVLKLPPSDMKRTLFINKDHIMIASHQQNLSDSYLEEVLSVKDGAKSLLGIEAIERIVQTLPSVLSETAVVQVGEGQTSGFTQVLSLFGNSAVRLPEKSNHPFYSFLLFQLNEDLIITSAQIPVKPTAEWVREVDAMGAFSSNESRTFSLGAGLPLGAEPEKSRILSLALNKDFLLTSLKLAGISELPSEQKKILDLISSIGFQLHLAGPHGSMLPVPRVVLELESSTPDDLLSEVRLQLETLAPEGVASTWQDLGEGLQSLAFPMGNVAFSTKDGSSILLASDKPLLIERIQKKAQFISLKEVFSKYEDQGAQQIGRLDLRLAAQFIKELLGASQMFGVPTEQTTGLHEILDYIAEIGELSWTTQVQPDGVVLSKGHSKSSGSTAVK